jgi:hypothetical protein
LDQEPMLRGESDLPAALSALLYAPAPAGVWHVPLMPHARAWHRLWPFGRKAPSGRRLGLWLTDEVLLLADEQEVRVVQRAAIRSLRVHRVGRRRRDHLAIEVGDARLRFPIDRLDGWSGRAEGLRSEVARRQREWRNQREAASSARPDLPIGGGLQSLVARYAASRDFAGMLRWLDEAMQGFADPASRVAAVDAMEIALSTWPDEGRLAHPDWYLLDGRFAGAWASWLLPLSRRLVLERELLPDAAAVRLAEATFRAVPLSAIEIRGTLEDPAFEVVLAWVASKKLQHFALPESTPDQQKQLAALRSARVIPG